MLSSHLKLHPRFLAKPIAPFRARVYTSLSRTPASEWKLLLGPEFYSPGTNINPAWLHGFPQLLHSTPVSCLCLFSPSCVTRFCGT